MTDESPITIYADTHEKDGAVLPRLQALGAQLKVGDLEAGSFVLSGNMAVLRLTANEFLDGVMDGSVFHKAGKLSMNFTKSVFIIEGDIHGTRHAIARQAIDGALAFLVGVNGASVLYSRGGYSTGDLLYRMARQAQKEADTGMVFQRLKASTERQQSLFTLNSVFGIGPAMAVKALDKFGSVHAFMNATPEQLSEIPGIGAKKADRIYRSLRSLDQE